MKFEINLYIVLVFIVPGLIITLFAILFLVHPEWTEIVDSLKDNQLDSVLVLIFGCFAIGALVDSIRSVVIDPILDRVLGIRPPEDYLSKINSKNLPIFTMLVDQTQVYYRLNSNVCFSFLVAVIIMIVSPSEISCWAYMVVGILLILITWASINARKASIYAMNQFVKQENI